MKLTQAQLQNHLNSQATFPCYWLSGNELVLMGEAETLLMQEFHKRGFTEKKAYDLSQPIDWNDVQRELENLSLFATKSVIQIHLGDKKLPDAGKKLLQTFVSKPVVQKVILIKSAKLDAATLKTKWFKSIEDQAGIIQIWPIEHQNLAAFVNRYLQQYQLSATAEAIKLLCDFSEGNLLALVQEIQKLSLLHPQANITREQVIEAVSDSARYNIFALVDAALQKNSAKSLRIFQNLKAEGEEPLLILWALAREIKLLKKLAKHDNPKTIQWKTYGIWPKRVALYQKALTSASTHDYENLLIQCSEVDAAIKGAANLNPWNALEAMVVQLAGTQLWCN